MRRRTTSRTWIGTDAQVVRHVRVYGQGHLATATRIELERQGIHRDSDSLLPSLRPALVIACADSEADQSINDAARQALEEGSPLLLCCLAGPVVRLGPLLEPSAGSAPASWSHPASASPTQPSPKQPARSQASAPASPAPADSPPRSAPASRRTATGADEPHSTLHPAARLGALLVSAQALNFLLGARNQCIQDRVVELNPRSMESKAYRVFHH